MSLTFPFSYTLIKKSKIKNITIKINFDNTITVTSPKRVKEHELKSLLNTKKRWIERKIKENTQKQNDNPPKEFIDGEEFLYLGKPIYLNVVKSTKNNVQLQKNTLILYLKEDIQNESYKKVASQQIQKWYKTVARDIIEDRVEIWGQYISKKPNQIRLKDTKTRWGSCSSLGNLNFNWKLIMAPLDVLDYIVIHELSHLIHPNHSKSFWTLVEQIQPRYKVHQQWLKAHSHLLQIIT